MTITTFWHPLVVKLPLSTTDSSRFYVCGLGPASRNSAAAFEASTGASHDNGGGTAEGETLGDLPVHDPAGPVEATPQILPHVRMM